LENIDSEGEQMKALTVIKEFIEIQKAGKVTFETCIRTAFKHFTADFITSIRNLLHTTDIIEKTKGEPFWTGTKRRPKEAAWDSKNPPPASLEYLYACANCYAFMFKVAAVRNRADFEKLVVAAELTLPEWAPPGGAGDEDLENEDGPKVDAEAVMKLNMELRSMETGGLQECEAHDFEKDDDSNFHIDFLTCGTNLRSANYDIKASDRAVVKVTAGKIIPALATTTAMVCGLVDNEFLKLAMQLHLGENAVDKFYNCNINLATGKEAINAFRPDPPLKKDTKLKAITEYTTWDKVVVNGELSVQATVEHLEKTYGCKVTRLHPSHTDNALFDHIDLEKLTWTIEFREGALVIEPAAVFSAWPQLKMAAMQIAKLPEGGGARKMFEGQVTAAQKSLQAVKDNFKAKYAGSVSDAYLKLCRPEDAEKQKYFDAVFAKRSYLTLRVHCLNAEGEEADLPIIRYVFRK